MSPYGDVVLETRAITKSQSFDEVYAELVQAHKKRVRFHHLFVPCPRPQSGTPSKIEMDRLQLTDRNHDPLVSSFCFKSCHHVPHVIFVPWISVLM